MGKSSEPEKGRKLGLSREIISLINRRAHQLARENYEDYRADMLRDVVDAIVHEQADDEDHRITVGLWRPVCPHCGEELEL